MLSKDLYEHVLLTPAKKGATLYVVSGYARATMAVRHLQDLQDKKKDAGIRLIVGMTAKDGIAKSNHRGLCSLADNKNNNFVCSYVPENQIPVHTKAYAWFMGESPMAGFVGSANYTQAGFFRHREAMDKSDPAEILAYYKKLEKNSCLCSHPDADGLAREDDGASFVRPDTDAQALPTKGVDSTLLDKHGTVYALNWGQPTENRVRANKNEAYIPLRAEIYKSGFFPERGVYFSLHTDDGHIFLCVRRQDEGKAIHTPDNNSLFGEYFRRRLGVELDDPVEPQHLRKYGRTDVTFYKYDDEDYWMDFAVK